MRASLLAAAFCLMAGSALAADPAACRNVRMGEPGWSDIAVTDGVAGTLLHALGYEQKIQTLGVPVIFQALANGQLDVFLGNWMPAQKPFITKLLEQKKVDRLGTNLQDAKFTLAVPTYVAQGGVHSFADLASHAAEFGKTIYGIEPGAPANQNIEKMLDAKAFGLNGWKMVASSEQAMLGEVARATARHKAIVFLAWEPHPMNVRFHITYLSGGDKYFGPKYGASTVYTVARAGYAKACPNLARLFGQLHFSIDMENTMMDDADKNRRSGSDEAARYIKAHPQLLNAWLQGVTTRDGAPGLPAVQKALGAH